MPLRVSIKSNAAREENSVTKSHSHKIYNGVVHRANLGAMSNVIRKKGTEHHEYERLDSEYHILLGRREKQQIAQVFAASRKQ